MDKFLIPININRCHSKPNFFECDPKSDKPLDKAVESFHLHIKDRTDSWKYFEVYELNDENSFHKCIA